jgi:uncharacterized protein involved in exopolysaccharide biosynthesis
MSTERVSSRLDNGQIVRFAVEEVPRLFEYGYLLKRRWTTIAAFTLSAAVATVLWAKVLAKPQYLATAALKPSQQESGDFGSGSVLASLSASSLLGNGDQHDDATEYDKILNSYNVALLVARHFHFDEALRRDRSWYSKWRHPVVTDYMIYQAVNQSFHSDYDSYADILTISFKTSNSERAKQVLGFYIDTLRGLLSHRQSERSRAAAAAIKDEAVRTQDVILQAYLFQAAADQMKNARLAEAQADYDFKVLDGPVADDQPYSPNTPLDLLIMVLVAFMASAFWVAIIRPLYDWYADYERVISSKEHLSATSVHFAHARSDDLERQEQRALR